MSNEVHACLAKCHFKELFSLSCVYQSELIVVSRLEYGFSLENGKRRRPGVSSTMRVHGLVFLPETGLAHYAIVFPNLLIVYFLIEILTTFSQHIVKSWNCLSWFLQRQCEFWTKYEFLFDQWKLLDACKEFVGSRTEFIVPLESWVFIGNPVIVIFSGNFCWVALSKKLWKMVTWNHCLYISGGGDRPDRQVPILRRLAGAGVQLYVLLCARRVRTTHHACAHVSVHTSDHCCERWEFSYWLVTFCKLGKYRK